MDYKQSNMFLFPIGLGSTYIFYKKICGTICSIDNDLEVNSYLTHGILLLTLVYFLSDFYLMIVKYNPKHNVYFVHHFIGIVAIYFSYMKYYYLTKYLFAYLTFELSTPFLNIAIKYRNQGVYNKCSIFSELTFFILFTIIRIIFGTYLWFVTSNTLSSIEYPYNYLIVLPTVLQLLNYWWYYRILKILRAKLFGCINKED